MEKENEMSLNEYQRKAMTTCMTTCDNFSYMFINLVGEIGEFASKVGKQIRKGTIHIGEKKDGYMYNHLQRNSYNLPPKDFEDELKKEAGDILWQLSGMCKVMGWDLQEIAEMNLNKLAARKAVGTIDGNGDGIEREK